MKIVFQSLLVVMIGLATVGCGGGNTVETPATPAAAPAEGPASDEGAVAPPLSPPPPAQ